MTDAFMAPAYHDPKGQRDNIIPRFYIKGLKNNFLSEQQGKEVFEDVEYVEMLVPGDKFSEVHERVKDSHKARWPVQYAAFKANQEAPSEGTPLEEWPPMSPGMVMQLKSNKVRTVEQLAALSDSQLGNVLPMGGHSMREKARNWLKQAEGLAPLSDMQQKLDTANAQIAALERQVADLASKKQEKAND